MDDRRTLTVGSDSATVRRYRAHQGRWREEELGLPAGRSANPRAGNRLVDSMLPAEHQGTSAVDAGWNLMSPAAVDYARTRLPEVRRAGGLSEPDRLWRNMLSSQPLAFSLVGELWAHPDAALAVLSELTGHRLVAFDTGLGGIATLPVTVPAVMAGLYVVGTRMAAGIAQLRGYDTSTEEVRSAILVALLGSAGAATLEKAGVEIGTRSAAVALERLPGRVLVELNRKVGYRLVTKAGEKGVVNLSKLVPLVGGPIGAAVDGVGCRTIATYALRTFPERFGGAVVVEGEVVSDT